MSTSADAWVEIATSESNGGFTYAIDDDVETNTNAILAHSSAEAAARYSDAIAVAHSQTTATGLIPIGSATGVPTVDVALTCLDAAIGGYDEILDAPLISHAENGTLPPQQSPGVFATSSSTFQFRTADPFCYDFHGTLFVGSYGGHVTVGDAWATAQVGVSSTIQNLTQNWTATVTAAPLDEDTWQVTGGLPGGGAINQTFDSLNAWFYFVVPGGVCNGDILQFTTNTGGWAGTLAIDSGSVAELQRHTAGSAFGWATPPQQNIAAGDVDADGDVDQNDLGVTRIPLGRRFAI